MISKNKNKILVLGLILVVLVNLFLPAYSIFAQREFDEVPTPINPGDLPTPPVKTPVPVADPNTNYNLLQPLPAVDGGDAITDFPVGATGALGKYLNLIIKLIIGLCAVAAVVMIVVGGIQWSASELISGKEDAKQRIWNAVLGLILALCSWLILYTINPDLLNTEVDIAGTTITSEGEIPIAELIEKIIPVGGAINSGNAGSVGTNCDANMVMAAAQASGQSITPEQAATMACIGGAESRGCKSITNFNWNNGSSAFGAWQILLVSHAPLFQNPACWAAAGVPAGTPLGCSSRSQLCIRAASNFNCNAAVALRLMRGRPNFMDWLVTQKPCNNAKCIKRFSPGTNLNISIPASSATSYIPNLAVHCRL